MKTNPFPTKKDSESAAPIITVTAATKGAASSDVASSVGKNLVVEVLRFEFSSRMEKNPQYSLRSFGKYLKVSHTLLSLILNGQRSPSKKLVEKIVERLCLNPDQKNEMLEAVQARKSPSLSTKKSTTLRYHKINLDQFALLSEWQHYAILSLLEIPDTELSPEFISKRLGIPEVLARISLQRLFEMELLEKDPSTGRWRQSTAPIIVENTDSTAHTRKFQTQMLNKAIESMEQDPEALRDLSSTTFAMDPKQVGYALKRIREFRRELTQELESFGEQKEVYNLTVQIFPTSRRKK